GKDLRDCMIEECHKDLRFHKHINVFYFLDSLCESSLQKHTARSSFPLSLHARHAKYINRSFHAGYVSRDPLHIIECVVPVGQQGILNST
ncbi:hypothetical protein EV363DRAFT_1093056, partial [Boletus edulis]